MVQVDYLQSPHSAQRRVLRDLSRSVKSVIVVVVVVVVVGLVVVVVVVVVAAAAAAAAVVVLRSCSVIIHCHFLFEISFVIAVRNSV